MHTAEIQPLKRKVNRPQIQLRTPFGTLELGPPTAMMDDLQPRQAFEGDFRANPMHVLVDPAQRCRQRYRPLREQSDLRPAVGSSQGGV